MAIPLKNNTKLHLIIIVLLVLTTRIVFLMSPIGRSIDADEAVVGLMAQKIAAFEEFPIYLWEAHYSGTSIAYIAAFLFHLFGPGTILLRSVSLAIALLSSALSYFIYRRLFGGHKAFIASLFLIFCPFLVLYYTSIAVNYGEVYLGTVIIMLLSLYIKKKGPGRASPLSVFLLGLACGFYFYTLFLVLPAILAFAFPAVFSLNRNRFKSITVFSSGGLIGLLPFIIYNLKTGGGSFLRAGGRVLSISRADVDLPLSTLFEKIIAHKIIYLKTWLPGTPKMFGLFLVPESFGDGALWTAGIFLFILFALFVTIVFVHKGETPDDPFRYFAYFLIMLILLQWLASLDRPRHLLPLLIVIPIVFIRLSGHRKAYAPISLFLLCLMSVFQLSGWPDRLRQPLFDPYPVARILKEKGIKEFYGQYWTVYPILFAGKGELVGSPLLLPFHEPFADRMPQDTINVHRSPKAAYVFSKGENGLEDTFLKFIKDNNIRYKSVAIDDTNIYFDFSMPVDTLIDSKGCSYFLFKQPSSPSAAS